MSYDPYGIGAPVVDVSGALGIDPMTGQPVNDTQPDLVSTLFSPTGLGLVAGAGVVANRRRRARAAAAALNTDGITRGTSASIRNLATQGQASRAGLLRAAVSRNPSAALQAATVSPTAAAPVIPNIPVAPELRLAQAMQGAAGRAGVPNIPVGFSPASRAYILDRGSRAQGAMSRIPTLSPQGPTSAVGLADDAARAAGRGRLAALGQTFRPRGGAAGVGLASLAATPVAMGVDRLNIGGRNSALDQFATGAAFGGTAGAAFGPWGAAFGAGVGGLGNLGFNAVRRFFGGGGGGDGDKADKAMASARSALEEAFDLYGADNNIRRSFTAQLETARLAAGDDPKKQRAAVEAAQQQLLAQLPQYVSATNAAAAQQVQDRAWQESIQRFAAPYLEQQRAAYEAQALQFEQLADRVAATNPAEADMYRFYAANARQAGASAGASFAAQVLMMPQLEAQRQAQEQQSALYNMVAQQAQAQAVSNILNPRQPVGGLADLMQPQ